MTQAIPFAPTFISFAFPNQLSVTTSLIGVPVISFGEIWRKQKPI
jgi:hypothetical protein